LFLALGFLNALLLDLNVLESIKVLRAVSALVHSCGVLPSIPAFT
jgi:hypothetical protein